MTQLNGRTAVAYCIVILCCAFYWVRGYHAERILLHSNDFKTIYGASRCLLAGGDPYDSEQAYKVYVAAGGPLGTYPAFREHEVLYLPPAIALVSPFALLRWHPADRLWLGLTTGIFVLGTLLIASLCLPLAPLTSAVAMGLMLVGNTMPVMLAQPEQLSSGLCAIAVWCFLQKRNRIAGVACMAVALVFKPHAVGLVWLFFLVCKEYRSRALQVAVATLIFSAPGLIWASVMPASSHWLHEVGANVAAFAQHGATNDPGPTNPGAGNLLGLQSLLSLIRDDAHFFNPVAYGITSLLILAWLLLLGRTPASRGRDYLALAAIALISMLPLYHREYDVDLLVVMFPGLAVLAAGRQRWSRQAAAITIAAWFPLSHEFFQVFANRHVEPRTGAFGILGTVFWYRSISWAAVLLALIYVGCLYLFQREQDRRETTIVDLAERELLA